MHIAKSPLFDQSAMAIALILTRERLPGSKRNKPPFGPEKFCKFMKLSSRDIAIEIHRRRLYIKYGTARYYFFGTGIAPLRGSKPTTKKG